jgi:glycosyltransferase involved in cell wall biosynthesis
MYKISIVIPCYNVELYINDCVLSLSKDNNFNSFQIILIDDGSTDNTLIKLKEFESLHSNIFVLTQKNAGQSAARNHGLEIARAEYIGFIDADDWVSPNYYSNLLTEIVEKNMDLVICNIASVDPDGVIDIMNTRLYEIDQIGQLIIQSHEERERLIRLYLRDRISVSPCNKLFRKTLLIENGIKFSEGFYNEDMEFTFDILMKVKRLMKIDFSTYFYRQNSTSTTKLASLRVLDMLVIVERILYKVNKNFGESIKQAEYLFLLNNSVYVTVMRLFYSSRDVRKIVVEEISKKMKFVPVHYIFSSNEISIKRRFIFLIIKYYPKAFFKLINIKWK